MTSKGEILRLKCRLRPGMTSKGEFSPVETIIKNTSFSRLRGNPARETGAILKFLEISEIKDFEDDGVGGDFEDDGRGDILKIRPASQL